VIISIIILVREAAEWRLLPGQAGTYRLFLVKT
jgi:hypothetical protein